MTQLENDLRNMKILARRLKRKGVFYKSLEFVSKLFLVSEGMKMSKQFHDLYVKDSSSLSDYNLNILNEIKEERNVVFDETNRSGYKKFIAILRNHLKRVDFLKNAEKEKEIKSSINNVMVSVFEAINGGDSILCYNIFKKDFINNSMGSKK